MRRPDVPHVIAALVACLAAITPSCGTTPPSRFYDLTPVEASEGTPSDVCVHVAAIELPRYLDGPGIVTRRPPSELVRAEFERWAEPLEAAFSRVLTANVGRLVPTERAFRSIWERPAPVDLALTVSVQRFDVGQDGAVLEATWKLSRGMGEEALAVRRTRYARPVEVGDYAAIPGALSALLGELGAEIAAEIRARSDVP